MVLVYMQEYYDESVNTVEDTWRTTHYLHVVTFLHVTNMAATSFDLP